MKGKGILKISNPDKLVYPKDHITKLDVINYYIDIAPHMLPFLKNRLLSIIRCHDGVKGECFFKKHPTTEKEMVEAFKVKDDEYFYIKDISQLVFQAQMGTIEFHPWGSKTTSMDKPDIMVFDLDPAEKLPINKLRDGVLKLKELLDELNLQSFLKTSGGKGYHILVPFSQSKDWESFENFSKQISLLLENRYPDIFTTNIRKEKRKDKIFIDYLRNSKGATCVAPYSLRARDSATISFPIEWEDLDKIKPNEININNYKKYLNNSLKNIFTINQKLK